MYWKCHVAWSCSLCFFRRVVSVFYISKHCIVIFCLSVVHFEVKVDCILHRPARMGSVVCCIVLFILWYHNFFVLVYYLLCEYAFVNYMRCVVWHWFFHRCNLSILIMSYSHIISHLPMSMSYSGVLNFYCITALFNVWTWHPLREFYYII